MPTQLPQAIVSLVRLSTSGFKDIGLGMGGGAGSLAIGSFLPVRLPNGFLLTGGVSQVAGAGFLGNLEEIHIGREP
jgi:hypothetical protein